MKAENIWCGAPKLGKTDWLWTLLPPLLWYLAVISRSTWIIPHCAQSPLSCTAASLWPMDRPAVGLELASADALSFTTQGLSGILAVSIPLAWQLGLIILRKSGVKAAVKSAFTDLTLFAQTTFLNGLFLEVTRLFAQRGRPFVYLDPGRAQDFSNYTSFYSGHTSFAAAAMVYLVLTLAGRGAPKWLLALASFGAYALISLTGMYRVLAGRHFPTDVLAGAIAGAAVAYFVALKHRKPLWP